MIEIYVVQKILLAFASKDWVHEVSMRRKMGHVATNVLPGNLWQV